ncbi:MAG: efflux RND transporter permease subunit, partial [Cyclonatronaceae bacterium]
MERLADFILAHQKPIIAITVLLVMASVYPVLNVKADFSLEGFFPEDDPTIDNYERFSEEYGRDDNAIVIGVSSDDVLDEAFLGTLQDMSNELAEIENVTDVRSIFDARRLQNNDGMLDSELYLKDGKAPEGVRREITSDAFTEGLFINEEATFTAIYLEIDEDNNTFPVRQGVIAAMENVIDNYPGLETYVAGIPYFRNQYVNVLNSEIIFYISISSVLIILLLWFLFRNAQGIVVPIMIVWLTILFTVAVLYLTGGVFEVLTSTIAPILLCVGVADSVHMISKYQDNRSIRMTRAQAMRESLIVLGSATFMTSVTTAIGFATLSTSNVIPMRTFGLYTAVGVMIAYIITI